MEDKISVVIPVYKVEPYLDQCVQSVVDQTYTNLEIILVDDGSPDNCPAMCDAWAERDERIKVVHKKNSGPSDARNAGMQIASGVLLFFIDSDDYISKDCIWKMKKAMDEAKADSAICKYVTVTNDELRTDFNENKHEIFSVDFERARTLRQGAAVCVWGILYPMSVIRKERLAFQNIEREDVYWNSIISIYIRSAVFVENGIYYYRKRPQQLSENCADTLRFAGSLFIAAKEIRDFCNRHIDLTLHQYGTLISERRRCINSAYYELYQSNRKTTKLQRKSCKKSQFTPKQILKAKLGLGQKLSEFLFQVAPGIESQFVYNLMFSLRKWFKKV